MNAGVGQGERTLRVNGFGRVEENPGISYHFDAVENDTGRTGAILLLSDLNAMDQRLSGVKSNPDIANCHMIVEDYDAATYI
jgi:hypothetical protein